MYHLSNFILLGCLLLAPVLCKGQTIKKRTPEEIATEQTDRMKAELTLTAKQAKQIYKIQLKQAREMETALLNGTRPTPPIERKELGGGGRPTMGGGEGRPSTERERPALTGMQPPMQPSKGQDTSSSFEQMLKQKEEKEKKFKKILSTEQYKLWERNEAPRYKKEADRFINNELKSDS